MSKSLLLLILVVGSVILTGCSKDEATPETLAPTTGNAAPKGQGGPEQVKAIE